MSTGAVRRLCRSPERPTVGLSNAQEGVNEYRGQSETSARAPNAPGAVRSPRVLSGARE
jgi:hypothetical protein